MVTLNIKKIKEEILNLIRNNDIFPVSLRGVTTTTDNFTAIASQKDFTLNNAGVKNIRSVKVDTVLQTLYTDYDINIEGATADESKLISFVTGLTGGEDVEINYDYSISGDKVYSDFPEDFLTVGAFPRIGFDIISISSTNRSANDNLQQKTLLIDFGAFALNKDLENYSNNLYDLIFANRKTFYWLNLLRPSGRSGKDTFKKFSSTLIYSKLFNYTAPIEFERD